VVELDDIAEQLPVPGVAGVEVERLGRRDETDTRHPDLEQRLDVGILARRLDRPARGVEAGRQRQRARQLAAAVVDGHNGAVGLDARRIVAGLGEDLAAKQGGHLVDSDPRVRRAT
jgi:hypothetical protein